MIKENILNLLPNGSIGILSTIKEGSVPDARSWQFQFEKDV